MIPFRELQRIDKQPLAQSSKGKKLKPRRVRRQEARDQIKSMQQE